MPTTLEPSEVPARYAGMERGVVVADVQYCLVDMMEARDRHLEAAVPVPRW